jgi:transcription elongation factor Elf1
MPLTCPYCGNNDKWKSVHMVRGKTTAVCGVCRETVTTTGGTTMGNVSGGMNQS